MKRDTKALLDQFKIPYIEKGDREWVTISCPYHKDHEDLNDAHGGVNIKSGAFKCFSCSATSNVISVIAHKMNVPVVVAESYADNVGGVRVSGVVDSALVGMCHTNLLDSEEFTTKLLRRHGITTESIVKYKLGIYPGNKRITIPVYGDEWEGVSPLINIKYYKYDADTDEAKMISTKGAPVALYLPDSIKATDVAYITEGEFKAILMNQLGFPTVASTGGANSWNVGWNKRFANKHVVIVYDVDAAGVAGAKKVAQFVHRHAKSVKVVMLTDVADIENGDVTDYFVKRQKSPQEFKELVANTAEWTPPTAPLYEEEVNDPIQVTLSGSGKAEYNNKIVSYTSVVSAKATAPYIVPKRCTVVCAKSEKYCGSCHVGTTPEAHKFQIPQHSPDLLEFLDKSEKLQKEVLKRRSGIYYGCKASTFKVEESYNIEELRLIPQISIGHSADEQVVRRVFYVGHGLSSNSTYAFTGRVCVTPDTSQATQIVYEANPVANDLDTFVLSETDKQVLPLFKPRCDTVECIEEKLDAIYADFADNVTRIRQRRDLHMFYDLAYHSALYFQFEGRTTKGWADVLVIGDSGQGKSECSSRMRDHYMAGERVDVKRASVAGLVGGLQETSSRWFITWGTIPLNDRRLVILEEVKGMGTPELTKLTDMRSSGIAEITKIERARTYARTRLIWISNPRSDSKISAYNYGVDAVKELVGSLEDIRRFDAVMAVASGEVPLSVVNANHDAKVPHTYTSEACSRLLSWAWSRTEKQVVFTHSATEEILAVAMRMGGKYSSACPIVEPSDQRLKIARLSVALAARLYSCDDTGEAIVVSAAHVTVVERFLERLYSSRALGYAEFSATMKSEGTIKDSDDLRKDVKAIPNARECVQGFLEADFIRVEDIQNFTEWTLEQANEFLGRLVRYGAIKRYRRGGYRKTSAFIDILKEMDRQGLSSETLKQKLQQGDM